MAGRKGHRAKDDMPKKRKREAHGDELTSKRIRAEQAAGEKRRRGSKGAGERQQLTAGSQENSATQLSNGAANKSYLDLSKQSDVEDAGWRVSKPMGGKMLDIDPILTADEQYLILTYNTSIQVYSAADSLLIRRIPISTIDSSASKSTRPGAIVATKLSKQDPNYVWVACNDGQVYHVNWTRRSNSLDGFQTESRTASGLSVMNLNGSKTPKDTLAVMELSKPHRIDVVLYQWQPESSLLSQNIFSLKKPRDGLQLLVTSEDGQFIVGALNDVLFIGLASDQQVEKLDQARYEFFSFDTPDIPTTLDLRISPAAGYKKQSPKKSSLVSEKMLDVIFGGARGGIYLYRDIIAELKALGKSPGKGSIQAQKYHWHRKAVHALKWSRDGNYMISGGSENVLVMWQLDTSRTDFLPHLSGSVENIVVSDAGSSYVLHLDDNSTMVISTAEMKPTAFVSGIQSASASTSRPKDLIVSRAWHAPENVRRPIPAASKPGDPSKLHVCVGNGRQATLTGQFSAPLLQTFDLESFSSVSKQALARTQPTDVNITNQGLPIDDPLVTHISFSADGAWLASVDDWAPAPRDVENVSNDLKEQFIQERHETYLKFWSVADTAEGDTSGTLALVSRINSPHSTGSLEAVLDLVSDPATPGFATIGSDGMVRLWRPRTRQLNGVVTKGRNLNDQTDVSWGCSQVIALGGNASQGAVVDLSDTAGPRRPQGSISFSEDGSTMFAAFGVGDAGAVYVIDTANGEVVKTLEGMWIGRLQALEVISSFIIILSEELRVYDIIGDELRYGIVMPQIPGIDELLQLAVDHTSGTFAVTLPVDEFSSVGVFDPEESQPLLVRNLPHRVVSLISAPRTSGFIALDDVAQVWVISEGTDSASLAAAQPLQDLSLDDIVGEEEGVELGDVDDAPAELEEEKDEMDIGDAEDVQMEDDDDDDDDSYPSVLPQQRLADIFDATPAFNAPSIEDMFYKVTSLLATKPLSAS